MTDRSDEAYLTWLEGELETGRPPLPEDLERRFLDTAIKRSSHQPRASATSAVVVGAVATLMMGLSGWDIWTEAGFLLVMAAAMAQAGVLLRIPHQEGAVVVTEPLGS